MSIYYGDYNRVIDIEILNIIGDSYSDTNIKKNDDETTYLELLEQNFKVKNYSYHGVGPQYIFEKLTCNNIGDFLFVILPDVKRIKFNYLTDENIASPVAIWRQLKTMGTYDFPKSFEKYEDRYEQIYKDFETFESSNMFNILPSLYVQYIISFYQKCKKILIWPTSEYDLQINFLPDNCNIMSKSLNKISKEENVRKKTIKNYGQDFRNNHLSKDNHIIMYNFLIDYFLHNIFYEPKFKKYNRVNK